MNFTGYALFSLVFCIVVFGATFGLCVQRYELETALALTTALWVSAPVGVFFICTSVLLFYKNLHTFINQKRAQKDFSLLIDQICTQANALSLSQLNPLESTHSPYTPASLHHTANKQLSAAIARFHLVPALGSQDSGNVKIDKLFSLYHAIAQGSLEDMRKYHLAHDNPFTLQNDKNYALKSNKNALEIFSDTSKSDEVRAYAFGLICESKNAKDLQKALNANACNCLDSSSLQQALLLCKELDISLESAQIAELCKQAGFGGGEYLALAKAMQSLCAPDEWLKYFENLADNDESAQVAYLFVLVELEMVSELERKMKSFDKGEMTGLRAYIELKRLGKHYPISAFVIVG